MIATALSIQNETEKALEFPIIPMIAKFIVENHNELDNDELMHHLFMFAKTTATTTAGFISNLLLGDESFEQMVTEMVEFDDLAESIINEGESDDDSTND